MNKSVLIAGVSFGILGSSFPQFSHAAPNPIFRKTATLRVQNGTADDYMIELGRAADINIVADVTQPVADDTRITLDEKKTVSEFVDNFVWPRDRLASAFDQRTMIFWPAPNFRELVKTIGAEQKAELKPETAPLTDEEAPKKWTEYFRQAHNWDGKWDGVDIKVAVDDLPADLRSQVQQEIERRMSVIRSSALMQRRASEEFWAKARLYVAPLSPAYREAPQPHMILWDFTQMPFPSSVHSTGINIILGSLQRPVR